MVLNFFFSFYLTAFRFEQNKGLTEERAAVILERDGPNDLIPIRRLPEIVRLAKNMFGGFAMLLWVGAFLCFFAHFLEYYTLDDPQYDNVCKSMLIYFISTKVFLFFL